jgi:hypothetical protein
MEVEDSVASQSSSLGGNEEEGEATLVQENDEALEQEQVLLGLARSEAASSKQTVLPSGSLLLSEKDSFLTLNQTFEPVHRVELAIADVAWSSGQDRGISCSGAMSILMLPFSFWPTEDKESPAILTQMLLSRKVELESSVVVPLWERARLPKEAAEFVAALSTIARVRRLRNVACAAASPD